MKKIFLVVVSIFIFFILLIVPARAQMMNTGNYPTPSISVSDIQSQQQEENEGKDLLDRLNNKTISCSDLTDNNFEKIGEYLMGQTFEGDTASHIATNNRMKSMMGESGEEQMHILWGKRGSGCDTNILPTGGGVPMMGWDFNNMMNGSFGLFTVLGFFLWLIATIDLVLIAVLLWNKIRK